MGLPSIQIPAPDESVLFVRVLKMTLKQLGVLYHNMALNSDPKSLVYNDVLRLSSDGEPEGCVSGLFPETNQTRRKPNHSEAG
jgi:hypothetical protein